MPMLTNRVLSLATSIWHLARGRRRASPHARPPDRPIPPATAALHNYHSTPGPHICLSIMVEATHGVLVTCDIPVKQFLLKLDNDRAPDRFIVAKLDDTHLFIHAWAVDMIKDQLERLFAENQYESLS